MTDMINIENLRERQQKVNIPQVCCELKMTYFKLNKIHVKVFSSQNTIRNVFTKTTFKKTHRILKITC